MRTLTPYWNTRSFAADLINEMDSFFSDFQKEIPTRHLYDERSFNPACEITEAEDHYVMSLDIPGMNKEDIKLELNENTLTVSGERKREVASDKKLRVQRYEKSYGFFKRSFTLPASVDSEKVEAHYEQGVLELYLPKTAAAKPKQIEIKTDQNGFFNKLLSPRKSSDSTKDASSAS